MGPESEFFAVIRLIGPRTNIAIFATANGGVEG